MTIFESARFLVQWLSVPSSVHSYVTGEILSFVILIGYILNQYEIIFNMIFCE